MAVCECLGKREMKVFAFGGKFAREPVRESGFLVYF